MRLVQDEVQTKVDFDVNLTGRMTSVIIDGHSEFVEDIQHHTARKSATAARREHTIAECMTQIGAHE